jgi:hypothetical protein
LKPLRERSVKAWEGSTKEVMLQMALDNCDRSVCSLGCPLMRDSAILTSRVASLMSSP